MDCPVCREPMIGLEYEKVEVDYCPACAGVWLDEGELEVLLGLEAPEVAALLSGGEDIAADEARRPCPACDRPMVKAAFGARDRVGYDRCPRHHGVFLDRGELAAVMEHALGFARGREISEFLRGVFVDHTEEPGTSPEPEPRG